MSMYKHPVPSVPLSVRQVVQSPFRLHQLLASLSIRSIKDVTVRRADDLRLSFNIQRS